MKNEHRLFNQATQVLIPVLTISSQLSLAFKYPQWALVISLAAQPFWLYSSWKSYKQAGQIGLFITAVVLTVIMVFGVVNYWLKL